MMASQTIKEKIEELQKSKPTPQNSPPKIQRVAYYRRKIPNLRKYYKPKLVSIGPIHHDNKNLKLLGEKYKLMWAAEYIENTPLEPENTALNAENFALKAEKLYKKIAEDINNLKGHFSEDVLTLTTKSLEGFGTLEEKLSLMLFVDGCSLLHILENARRNNPGKMNIKVDQLFLVMVDVVLLENQLPYEVLKLLWKNENESELIQSMTDFFKYNHWAQSEKEKDMGPKKNGEGEHSVSIPLPNESPTHLLDHLRKLNLTTSKSKINNYEANAYFTIGRMKTIYMNIKDLKALGIRLKSSKTRRPRDIDFSEGWFTAELTLPEIVVDDTSAATFINLIAYEMCPDFDNDYGICSFVSFMDSLIDHPEDVKVLRSKGIFLNCLGSDEEVVELFKIISTDLVPNSETYFEVKDKMIDHYYKYRTSIVRGYYTYFRIAAFIALALTFIQTVFTVYPTFKKDGYL